MRSIRSRVARSLSRATPALAVLAVVGATLAATGIAPTAGAATRTVSVTPASELTDQVVQVHWTGFAPTTPEGLNQVIIVQCKGNPRSLADCFTAAPFPNSANGNEVVNGTTQKNGTGTAALEIRPAAQLPELGCNTEHPCSVLVYENQVVAPGKLPTLSAIAPIAFGRSTADCPPVRNFDVRVEGEASGAPVLYDWAARRCTGANHLVVDYTETSSDSGRSDYLKKLVDVGVTSLAATPAELKAAPGYPPFAYAPIDLTGVAVVYNIHDPNNQAITDMTLSPRLLARLISNSDVSTFFQDPEFKRLNPKHVWPYNGASPPLIRAESNADTWITTKWIASNAKATAFLQGRDADHVPVNFAFKNVKYPTDIFENRALDDSYLPRQGEYQVVTHVFYGARPIDTSPLDPAAVGFIGVVDLATAQRFDLPTAKLVNAAGKAVAPTATSLTAGYHAMLPGPGGTLVPNVASTDPAAYPLVKVDYAMVPTHTDDKRRAHVRDLLAWGATEGQKTLPEGYLPLPDALAAQSLLVAAGIAITAPPTTVASTTTTTTRSTATTTTTVPSSVFPSDSSSCCSSSASSLGGVAPVTAGATPTTQPVKGTTTGSTARRGAVVATPTETPTSAPPDATIASAGATLAVPVLFAGALLAALFVALRRAWPRMARSRRVVTRLLHPSKLRGAPSGTA